MGSSENFERIPSPISGAWREFRIKFLPLVIFLMACVPIYHLWRNHSPGGRITGIGEGRKSLVSNPRTGVLTELKIQPFQWVDAGTPILTIQPVDPEADLGILQSELQLMRLMMEPTMADRNALDFEQVRISSLRLKEELALARVNLERAESALRRNETLVKDRLVSADVYDLSKRDRDYYRAEIEEKTKASKEIEDRIAYLRSLGDPTSPGSSRMPLAVVAKMQARLATAESNWNPVVVLAPISGVVHLIYRQAKEFVVAGEPLLTIVSPQSDRIVAYLREPNDLEPKQGMEVQVLRQTSPRQMFTTHISQVGPAVEIITNALANIRQGGPIDVGLPIVMPVPANVTIRPGEIVSLEFSSEAKAGVHP